MQKALEILRNCLEKRGFQGYVSQTIRYLHYRCVTEKSLDPLKKFFVNMYLGHMWPYDD
jgi:hypothetical protein